MGNKMVICNAHYKMLHSMKWVVFVPLLLLLAGCEPEIRGCTDPSAPNYNPEANRDDGSCNFQTPDDYRFFRSEVNTVSYALPFSRQLLIAKLATCIQSLGEPGAEYQFLPSLIDSVADTLTFAPLASNISEVVPATYGSLGQRDTLQSILSGEIATLVNDGFAYIDGQAQGAGLGSASVYISPNGIHYNQLIPVLLRARALYAPIDSFLGAIDTLNNIQIVSNGATAAEASWDLAWGCWGSTPTFPIWYSGATSLQDGDNNDTLVFQEEYLFAFAAEAIRRAQIVPAKPFDRDMDRLYRQGRAALAFGPEQLGEVQAARDQLRPLWDELMAATLIHYINEALKALPDTTSYGEAWSVAYGYAWTLQLGSNMPGSSFMDAWLNDFGSSPSIDPAYIDGLTTLRNQLGTQMGFSVDWVEAW